jgi:glycerol-3-phosphate dehydrogenase (NAD(P)+)
MVLGCGAMGGALGHCLRVQGIDVKMLALPQDKGVWMSCVERGEVHPSLGVKLHEDLAWCRYDEVKKESLEGYDVWVAVSSGGLLWAEDWLSGWDGCLGGVVFATKGMPTYKPVLRILEGVRGWDGKDVPVSVLAGPCLAKELARGMPTSLVVAGKDRAGCEDVREMMEGGSSRVRVEISDDVEGVSWCAALKNIYAIGVSALEGHKFGMSESRSSQVSISRNGMAGLFSQSVKEMELFLGMLGLEKASASGLAGAGDLYVTVGGGRNGQFGRLLGGGMVRQEILEGAMRGVTVEGLSMADRLQPMLDLWEREGKFRKDEFPLLGALLKSLLRGKKFVCPPWIV